MSLLEVRGISKAFRGLRAVSGASFEVAAGEFFVGGAGQSPTEPLRGIQQIQTLLGHVVQNDDSVHGTCPLCPPLSECQHVIAQLFDAGQRHRIVDRGAHPADRAVPLQTVEARGGRLLHEGRLECLAGQAEGNVHERAGLALGVALVELRPLHPLREQLADLAEDRLVQRDFAPARLAQPPDEALRHETRFFTTLNQFLLMAIPLTLLGLAALVTLARTHQLPERLMNILGHSTVANQWLFLLLTLLPVAMTMALLWKIKEVVFASVFGPGK